MNYRNVQLIELLSAGKPWPLAELAARLNVSERLIRYDIVKINEFLSENGFPEIYVERKTGAALALGEADTARLLALLGGLSAGEYFPDQEKRREYILMLLLDSDDYLTSQFFADRLMVSKSSIDKDIATMRAEHPGELLLEGRTGRGVCLVGDEHQLRNIAFGLVSRNIAYEAALRGEYEPRNYMEEAVAALCSAPLLPAISRAVTALEINSGQKFTYNSYKDLVLYLGVSVHRIQKGKPAKMGPRDTASVSETGEYLLAQQLARTVERHLNIPFCEQEATLVATMLMGAKYVASAAEPKENWATVQMLSDLLISRMEKQMGFSFSADKMLYHALQQHLRPGILRLKNRMPVNNPNLEQIKRSYAGIYNALVEALKDESFAILEGIGEDEIGYMALHFCASLERQKRNAPSYNVVVVCTQGVGTGNLIKEMLYARFPNLRVLEVTTRAELQELQEKYTQTVELIVSSVPASHPSIPVVQVSPILTESDYQRVAAAIQSLGPKGAPPGGQGEALFQEIMETVEMHCEVRNTEGLKSGVLQTFRAHNIPVQVENKQPGLTELLNASGILAQQEADTWEDAVKIGGGLITQSGAADQRFIQSMLRTVKEAGPYVVIADGVALPHGEMGVGVSRLAMSLITLKTPVPFFHPLHDPVSVIVCLAPKDDSSHLRALAELMALIQEKQMDEIKKAKTARQIQAILA